MILLFSRILKSVRTYCRHIDIFLALSAIIAALFGLLLVTSASKSFSSHKLIIVQSAAIIIGLVAMVIISSIDYETLCELYVFLFGLSILALIITIIFGYGPTGTNNRNWLSLGFVDVQPSELVKLSYIISLAATIDKAAKEINSLKYLLFLFSQIAIICGLILVQGDMGSMLVFLMISVFMLFVSGVKLRLFAIGLGTVALAAPLIWQYGLSNYMKDRILFGFNPELDPSGVGYQAVQSKLAIGSGQLLGKGLFKGPQIQNELVPAKETDFIFAVSGEEFGFIGSILVVLVLFAIMLRILSLAWNSETASGSAICIGVLSMFFFQTVENIGMCLGVLPVIGITLPFFSYGGSSMLSSFCAIGLVLSVSMHRKTLSFHE